MKIPVTKFGICDKCRNRKDCPSRSKNVGECLAPSSTCGKRVSTFVVDQIADKANKRQQKREAEAWLAANLHATDRSQIDYTPTVFEIVYKPKPKDVRRFNSRSIRPFASRNDGLDLMRFCENCGKRFKTVNQTRRLCDGCHDEICETLGVDYSAVAGYTKNWAKMGGRE